MDDRMIPLSVLREYMPKLKDEDLKELGPVEYNQSKVPEVSKKHAENVRRKVYLPDMTESFARGVEYAGLIASEAVGISNETKERQDTVETQFNSVQQELTDKDPISAPEIIAARNGEATLSERLDKEQQEVNEQLARTDTDIRGRSLNVKMFGAVGDGITDDTLALQGAIDYLKSNFGGGEVLIPSGRYLHSSLYIPNNITISGVGERSKLINKSNESSFFIGEKDGTNSYHVRIRKLWTEGDPTLDNQHGVEFINSNPAYIVIEEVIMRSFGGHGIYGGHDGNVNNVEIKSCWIRYCRLDGINMKYRKGQINAIWIHDNDISENRNGITTFGNNVVITRNTIQANRLHAVSYSNEELKMIDGSEIDEACYGSSYTHNYTELNGTELTENVSLIGIYVGYEAGSTSYQKVLRNLDISDNMFGENGSKYKSIIHVEDLKNTDNSSRACVIYTRNNFGHIPIISYNKSSIFGQNTVIDEEDFKLLPEQLMQNLPKNIKLANRGKSVTPFKRLYVDSIVKGEQKTLKTPEQFSEIMLVSEQHHTIFYSSVQALTPNSPMTQEYIYNKFGNKVIATCHITSPFEFTLTNTAESENIITYILYR